MLSTLSWTGSALRLLDQTSLPTRVEYVDIVDEKQMWDAIKRLVVRGAPAIGVSAAFGAYLGVRGCTIDRRSRLREVCVYLATSRPTAVNLFWALDRIQRIAQADDSDARLLQECLTMLEEDKACCRAIGEHGLELLKQLAGDRAVYHLHTHCNAGALATVAYGTALAPIYVGLERGTKFHVFADETRPLLQGSRITATELSQAGVDVTVLCDNMAASLMGERRIDAVFVGADRITRNGDAANKIGTFALAIIARHFRVPFVVLAPTSTIDNTLADGTGIPIEHRDPREVLRPYNTPFAPESVAAYNPAFDVTPAHLITATVTEHGVHHPPFDFKTLPHREQ
jgi:methylthioribose-1-phosphate isomerase